MKPRNPPPASYAFGYRTPPQPGNEINGLGEGEKRRARHVFHNATGEEIAWKALDDFFSVINSWRVVRHMLANTWLSVPASPNIVFAMPFEQRWRAAAGELGIDISQLSPDAGHA